MKQKYCCKDFTEALEDETIRVNSAEFVINEYPSICEGDLQGNYEGIKITFCPFCGRKIGE